MRNVVLGANGRVGSALVSELSKRGMPVTAVIRNKGKINLFSPNVEVCIADIFDADSLTKVFKNGDTVFLMTPESMHSEDVIGDAEKVIENYRQAIIKSGVKRIIGLSSMGAHIGEGSGNLLVSYMLEKAFVDLPVETTFIRPAYYYSNWFAYLDVMQAHGVLPTFFNPDQKIPMISPNDVAEFAAVVMSSQALSAPVYEVRGPSIYSSNDIARIFGEFFDREVAVQQIPQEEWIPTLKSVGFSDDAAYNMALMTATVVNTTTFAENPKNLIIWNTDMKEYLSMQ
ncbi:MAG: NAD(P)H-binding protein [Dysgonomonas sp.]|nr:NAD(P)H-binding protein [Dysgonomonas sp.]